jgi:hypothetical protein
VTGLARSALAALALLAGAGCSALRLPAADDPDRSRHAYEIVGEVRTAKGLVPVAGARLEVRGAAAVSGSAGSDATGRFWLRVEGITPLAADRAGIGTGPAGAVWIGATSRDGCAPEVRVLLPAAGPVVLQLGPCTSGP